MAEVSGSLASTRLLTLTGAGGCGKTRLALEVARSTQETYRDGLCWVELASVSGAMAVPQAIAAALDVREQPEQPIIQTLAHWLADKQLLLLLDNCEHVLADCAQLAEVLLAACPNLRIIATSCESLGVAGEAIWPVPPLSLPELDDLAAVTRSEAAALFVDRAARSVPGFTLTEANAPAIARICRRLDGMPLAIELAAARVNVLTEHQIAIRLDDRFALLTTGDSGSPPRHQTLRAAIDWSYELLSPEEQALLQRMAVFASGCSLDAAETVCALGDISRAQILDLVASLVARSLVNSETTGRVEARYRMLETIREYACERLVEAGEEARPRNRHLDYYLAQAEEIAPKLRGAYQQLWLNWLEEEHDNLRAALRWAQKSGEIEDGLRLVVALYDFWIPRGHLREAVAWAQQFLEQAPDNTSPLLLAQANLSLAGPAWLMRDFAGMEQRTAAAVALAERAGEEGKATLAFALFGQASMAMAAGDYTKAFQLLERSLGLRRELGEKSLIAFSLLGLADAAAGLGKSDVTRSALEEGLALSDEAGERFWNANLLNALGTLERLEDNPREAAAAYEQSLARFRALGAEREVAVVLRNLALVRLDQGVISQARALLQESLALHQELDNIEGMIAYLAGSSELAAALGLPRDAVQLLAAADGLAEMYPVMVFPAEQLLRNRFRDALQVRLPAQTWEQAQQQGHLLSLEEAIALAESLPEAAQGVANVRLVRKGLTRREREVAALVTRGLTNREIAGALVISRRTVEKHIANIFSKLHLTDRTQLVLWSIEHGLADAQQ